jgi:hypothetical protein
MWRFHEQLLGMPEVLSWLAAEQAIDLETVKEYAFGWGQPLYYREPRIIIPIRYRRDGLRLTYRLRAYPTAKLKEAAPRGHPLGVWPWTPTYKPRVVLTESPLKAAVLRQLGFMAYGLPGASQYRLAAQVGRRVGSVYVLFDNDAGEQAGKAVGSIKATGNRNVYRCDLPEDWPTGSDVTDAVVKHGWTSQEFKQLLTAAWSSAHEEEK